MNYQYNLIQGDEDPYLNFFPLENRQFKGNSSIFENDVHWQQKQHQRKKNISVFQVNKEISDQCTNEKLAGQSNQSSLLEIYGHFSQDHKDQIQFKVLKNIEQQDIQKSKKSKQLVNPQFTDVFSFNSLTKKKNNNVPKHLMKRLIDLYGSKGKKFFEGDKQILKQVNKFMLYERKMYDQNKNWNNNLDAMQKLFGFLDDSKDSKKRSYLMRKMAHTLIRDQIIPGIYFNKQIKGMAKSYIYTLKIQMIRCRNPQLMKRTEII